jgi:RNA polymerase sigma factor (sigma-70 family)
MALGAVPLRTASDDRLAALAAAGDERAFTVIFERHHQPLYRYCRSLLGNTEDASDALQSTMLRALRALPGEKRTIALKPWLFRIAHNEAITIIRRRRPQVDVEDEALGLQAAAELDSDTRERVEHLFEDLKELPDRQRSALVMRELSGLSYDEIAAALHTSTGAATQAVFGARKALHEFAEGRDMECEAVQHEISRRDGRILASRKIRAHLRRCEDCSAFRAMIAARERELAAMAPPLPAMAAAAMLEGLQGGGGISGGLGGFSGAAGSSHAVVTAVAMKAAPMIAAAAVGAGAGAIVEAETDVSSLAARAEPASMLRAYAGEAGQRARVAALAETLSARLAAGSVQAGTPAARDAGGGGGGGGTTGSAPGDSPSGGGGSQEPGGRPGPGSGGPSVPTAPGSPPDGPTQQPPASAPRPPASSPTPPASAPRPPASSPRPPAAAPPAPTSTPPAPRRPNPAPPPPPQRDSDPPTPTPPAPPPGDDDDDDDDGEPDDNSDDLPGED